MKNDGMYRDAYGRIRRNTHNKVCAQCKHFYVRVDEQPLMFGPELTDERHYDEIRLCYEIHWCNAASPVCDGDFEPVAIKPEHGSKVDRIQRAMDENPNMTDGKLEQILDDDSEQLLDEDKPKVSWVPETEGIDRPTGIHVPLRPFHVLRPMPQKEIQYVYIGLLQENPNAKHKQDRFVEVPTEINGVATNYRRVEMGPLDWDVDYIHPLLQSSLSPSTATNAVPVEFPIVGADLGCVEHFGMYDCITGILIKTAKLSPGASNITAGDTITMPIGILKVSLNCLTDNKRKKGGE